MPGYDNLPPEQLETIRKFIEESDTIDAANPSELDDLARSSRSTGRTLCISFRRTPSIRAEYRISAEISFPKIAQVEAIALNPALAEYGHEHLLRWTNFLGTHLVEPSSGTSSETFSESSTGWIDNNMHVGRIGVTRYFTMED